MILRIRFDGKIAECELMNDEFGNWLCLKKKNIENIFCDMEQGENGFQDVIEIDLQEIE